MYFWFQKTGGDDPWVEALSEHRERVSREVKPAFVTVLDAHTCPSDDWGREEYTKMKYSGPLYFDWDAKDLGDGLAAFQGFLRHLQGIQVDLHALSLYATGGRGFHVEIPEAIFQAKVPRTGTAGLPYIYGMMALDLVTDHMDMRVYSGRKGRMWRTAGVKRANGLYKVPLSVDEALTLTVETYASICSTPRPAPTLAEPKPNLTLSTLFSRCQDRIEQSLRNRSKPNGDLELLAKYGGKLPPTLQRLMSGEGIAHGKGFQAIALQLAISANALGKSCEEMLADCEGLIESHSGDSSRYGSADKRRAELARMWDYTHENPCYTYSRGAIRSLCVPGAETSDLDGTAKAGQVGSVPDDRDESANPESEQELADSDATLVAGMSITKMGVYKRSPDGVCSISNVGFSSPAAMIDTADKVLIGIEAAVYADGKPKGRHLFPLQSFKSRTALSETLQGFGGIFTGPDPQASIVQLLLSRKAMQTGNQIYIVHREGLDLVQNPTKPDEVRREVIWAAPDCVLTNDQSVTYKFSPELAKKPVINTDIHLCKPVENTPDTRAFLHALLGMNDPIIISQMVGWFVSCFHKQFYVATYHQFPLLHPNGIAHSGKSMSIKLMQRLFHNATPPAEKACPPGASTPHALKSYWTSSASVPVMHDEYKPSELGPIRRDFLLQHFRLLYNQASGGMGGINRGGAGSSYRDITDYTYSAPVIYAGEAQELQTAVMQRSIPLFFNLETSMRYQKNYDHARDNADFLPGVGRLLLSASMRESVDSRREALNPIVDRLRKSLSDKVVERTIFNTAVVLAGLDFLKETLRYVFDDEFTETLENLSGQLFDQKDEIAVATMSEPSKVLEKMFMISRTEDEHSEFAVREGYEFCVVEGGIEILMKEAFTKYFAWSTRKGFNPLYSSDEGFIRSVSKLSYVSDTRCMNSALRKNMQQKIFRFDIEKLIEEGVELPKARSLGN